MIYKNRLLFLHIPKTAGTSLNSYLEAQFDPADTELHIENHILGQPKESFDFLNEKNLLSAHLKYDTLKNSLDLEKFFTITLLRDPIRQTLSHLSWMKHIGFPENKKKFDNHPDYIKQIVGRMHTLSWGEYFATMNHHEKNFFDNCQTRYMLPTYGDTELDESYQYAAIQNLHRINLAGTIEKFDQFLLLLAFYMGWQPPSKTPRKNLSLNKYSIDPVVEGEEFIINLEKLTRHDNVLYKTAQDIFTREVQNTFQLICSQFSDIVQIDFLAEPDEKAWEAFSNFIKQKGKKSKRLQPLSLHLSKIKRFAKNKIQF